MARYTDKTTVTRAEYLQLAGLLTLARDVMRDEKRLVSAVAEILGEKPDNGHAPDAVYNGYTVDELLTKSGITVAEDVDETRPNPYIVQTALKFWFEHHEHENGSAFDRGARETFEAARAQIAALEKKGIAP